MLLDLEAIMKKLFALTLLLAITGCASYPYHKDGRRDRDDRYRREDRRDRDRDRDDRRDYDDRRDSGDQHDRNSDQWQDHYQ